MKETIVPFAIVGGVFALTLVAAGVWVLFGGNKGSDNEVLRQLQQQEAARQAQINTMDEQANAGTPYEIVKGLTAQEVAVGEGNPVVAGQTVAVKYIGQLTNGQVFDSSDAHGGAPFTFTLGGQQVIKGWDIGVVGMRPGGVRMLTIAPELAYGDREIGGMIPANSTLIFRVEMIGPVQ